MYSHFKIFNKSYIVSFLNFIPAVTKILAVCTCVHVCMCINIIIYTGLVFAYKRSNIHTYMYKYMILLQSEYTDSIHCTTSTRNTYNF